MTEITQKPFFSLGEVKVPLFTLRNSRGMEVDISTFGAAIVAVRVPDREGVFADVVLGYSDSEGYRLRKYFLGVVVGRCANRIKGATFTLGEKEYKLNKNNGDDQIHGGLRGFDVRLWEPTVMESRYGQELRLTYTSPDGEENYPGTLSVKLTYSLSEQNELIINYEAVSDADTICNLTNHSYFNLAGHDSGNMLDQELKLYADFFTESDDGGITTGNLVHVEGTPMDFREFHRIGERHLSDCEHLKRAGGYDHNFVIKPSGQELTLCAEVRDPASGRHLYCLTDRPGVQFYAGNFIDGTQAGKNGVVYQKWDGLCLETQFAPDAIHHPEWESPILKAGQCYDSTTIYRFDVDA